MAESVAGLCSEKQQFRRLILRYAPNGQVTSLTKELFKPCGSFDYEKRASTSIRRSMDTRRPNVQARSPAPSCFSWCLLPSWSASAVAATWNCMCLVCFQVQSAVVARQRQPSEKTEV